MSFKIPGPIRKPVTIAGEVCNIEPCYILSDLRSEEFVTARHVAIWLVCRVLCKSTPWAAPHFELDVGSIGYAVKRVERLRNASPVWAERTNRAREKLLEWREREMHALRTMRVNVDRQGNARFS